LDLRLHLRIIRIAELSEAVRGTLERSVPRQVLLGQPEHDLESRGDIRDILNWLQIKEMLLLNSIMDFVWKMAKAFRLISEEQRIIINWQQIKDLLLLKPIMEIVWRKAKAFRLISKEQHIIINWQQIKDLLLLN
jgi:hypothetical protein